jgi:hypothetical protein
MNTIKLMRDIDRTETALWGLRELRNRRAAYQNQAVAREIERLENALATLRGWL